MAIFGSSWGEDYDHMEEYETHIPQYRDECNHTYGYDKTINHFDGDEYDVMEEYENGIKHFND